MLRKMAAVGLMSALVSSGLYAQEQKPTREQVIKNSIETAMLKLGSDHYLDSFEAKTDLLEFGQKAVPALLKALSHEKPEVRFHACEILGQLRAREAVEGLLDRAKNDAGEYGKSIASAAVAALGLIGDERVIPDLLKMLDASKAKVDTDLRYEIIVALGRLRAVEAEPMLKKALEDKVNNWMGKSVAIAAVDGLAKIYANDAIPDLAKLLTDTTTKEEWTGRSLSFAAAQALQRLTGKNFGPLWDEVSDESKAALKKWSEWWEAEQKGAAEGKIIATRETLKAVAAALEAFKKDVALYPTTLSELQNKPTDASGAKWKGPYLKELPKDAWNHDFVYSPAGANTDYFLMSNGAEGGKTGIRWDSPNMLNMKTTQTKTTMKSIADALEKFKLDEGRYPEKLVDLVMKPVVVKNWKGPYVSQLPKDDWGNDFGYKMPGTEKRAFDLYSFGADGKEGGTGNIYYGK